ncbi:hypothetical protein WJX81_000111 [Elliptochloris bilobata]|uniref:Uncharacterized protein n=1 Tax=Elliptochloris bilobata TaxID=381761 RepID=A0AAW1RZD3_9CHLO
MRERAATDAACACAAEASAAQEQAAALREHVRSVDAHAERLATQLAGAEAHSRELQVRLEAAVARVTALEQAGRDADALARIRLSTAELRAAAAEERAAAAEARLAQREAAMAANLAVSERAATIGDGLTQERLQTLQDRAEFVEKELREQLADARTAAAAERRHRQAAAAAEATAAAELQNRADRTAAELHSLRHQVGLKVARIAALEEACRKQDAAGTPARTVAAANDVVTSLVDDLQPPDSDARAAPIAAEDGAAAREAAAPPAPDAPAGAGRAADGGAARKRAHGGAAEPPPAVAQQAETVVGTAEPAHAVAAPGVMAGSRFLRPIGVSKIDLLTVWGKPATESAGGLPGPAGAGGGPKAGAQILRPTAVRPAAAGPAPAPALAANPLAALRPGVLEAALVRGRAQPPETQQVFDRSVRRSQQAPAPSGGAAKRRLLGLPRPSGAIAALPQSTLFGALQPPRLLGGK